MYLTKISGNGEIKDQEKFRLGRLDLRKQLKEGKITPQQNGHMLKILEKDCFEEIDLSLKSIFNSENRIFADWYTGEITCPYGEIIQYIHMGYGSIYSNKLIFNIIEGVVIDVKDITNQLNSNPQINTGSGYQGGYSGGHNNPTTNYNQTGQESQRDGYKDGDLYN